jgi:hypothetical protein
MKTLIFGLLLLLGSTGFAKVGCAPCLKAAEIVTAIETSHIKAEPLNPKTFDAQMKFVDDADPVITKLLTQKNFKEEHAEALLRLLRAVRPYDLRAMIPESSAAQFAKVYERPDKVLAKKLDALVLAATFTAADKKAILEWMQILPVPAVSEDDI